MSQYYIGQTFDGVYPPAAAIWCQANNAQIKVLEGKYTIVERDPVPGPTMAEKVRALEFSTGLTRAVRELVLAENSGASDYVKAKAKEIEALAEGLRGAPAVSARAEIQKEEGQ